MIETPEDKEEFQLRGCRPGTETEETDPGTGREAAAEGGDPPGDHRFVPDGNIKLPIHN